MIACREALPWIQLYIDGELAAGEVAEVEQHLADCERCRAAFEHMRHVSDNIRASIPLYEAAAGSEARVREMVRTAGRSRLQWRIAAVACVAAVLILASFLREPQPDPFSDFAAGSHIRYANGIAPLDVASSEPSRVSQWLAHRLPFHFKLPQYVNEPGNAKRYSLAGTRLLQYRDTDVAYLAYNMNERPISLLVASAEKVTPSGGQTFRTGGIDFHFSSDRGLRLITWRDRGLSYALVSDLDVTGAQSCVICHGSAADRGKIGTLPQ